MSLLMDALKKAEKSKQGGTDTPPAPDPAPATDWPTLSLDPRPAAADLEAELGLTPVRAAMPTPAPPRQATVAPAVDFSLEPLPAASSAPAPVAAAPVAATAPARREPAPNPMAAAADADTAARAADRLAAKGIFNAKRTSAAPSRAPFYAVLGALLAAGAGGAYYVWDQTQPAAPAPAPMAGQPATAGGVIGKASNASPPAPQPLAAAAPAAEIARPAADAPAPAPSPSPAGAIPGLAKAVDATSSSRTAGAPIAQAAPSAAPVQASRELPPATPAAGARPANPPANAAPATATGAAMPPTSAAEPRGRRERAPGSGNAASASGGTPVTSPANLRVTRDRAVPTIDPAVNAGYAALAEGNIEAAREHYARALASDGNNRDALLGMAAVALRSGRAEAAEGMYQKLIELYPRDAYANAQLAALRGGGDAAVSESRVKSLLAGEKDAATVAPLNFSLGNQFAAQSRWAEAQQAYFNAFAGEPDNPDYCYNLAVSLDQIRQPKLAHEHYVRALELAQKRRAGFDQARAKARIEQLAAAAK